MADASKLRRFGAPPPSLDEAREDLIPPPAEPQSAPLPTPAPPPPVQARQPDPPIEIDDYERVDGRSLRKTGRTIPFSTRLNADTDRLIRRLAGKHGILIAEVVERGVKLLQEELSKQQS
jgi:hypothetical protein